MLKEQAKLRDVFWCFLDGFSCLEGLSTFSYRNQLKDSRFPKGKSQVAGSVGGKIHVRYFLMSSLEGADYLCDVFDG